VVTAAGRAWRRADGVESLGGDEGLRVRRGDRKAERDLLGRVLTAADRTLVPGLLHHVARWRPSAAAEILQAREEA
jgi:hypothetical protein